ncbi:glycosaminoglycan attachment protein [Brachyspira murdochii]|uniref:glycosaminoglycan attachment protein n=1 Tax=Brachyspira murdochii TaxID=84378 RepID=UPI0012F4F862|nr:glycosaminoglycan attachment protein [Brachyspira murdochii]
MKKIDVKRFNAFVSFTRHPVAETFLQEIEWYENNNSCIFATIILDKIDKDFSVVILRRDENKIFRCSNSKDSISTIEKARQWMIDKIEEIEKSEEYIFIQGDEKNKKKKDIFEILNNKNISDDFIKLKEFEEYEPAKLLISEIMPHYIDIDGNFIEQFQTTGFDSRIWELYLFCYLNEEKFIIDKKYNAPDFYIHKGNCSVSIEATILGNKKEEKNDNIEERIDNILPFRFGSAIKSKMDHLNKDKLHYWEYEHTKNLPFMIAIEDFSYEISMTYSSTALQHYLYGYSHSILYDNKGNLKVIPKKIEYFKYKDKVIEAGFFLNKENENVSAILSSTSGTISKFLRIGKQSGFDKYNKLCITQQSLLYDPNPNASEPIYKEVEITEYSNEKWSDGISIYHNPNAKFPIDRHLFPNATHHFFKDGFIETISKPYSVISSITNISKRGYYTL